MAFQQTLIPSEVEQIGLHNMHYVRDLFKRVNIYTYYACIPAFYSHYCCGIYRSYVYKKHEVFTLKYENKNPRVILFEPPSEGLQEYLMKRNPLFIRQTLYQGTSEAYKDFKAHKIKFAIENDFVVDTNEYKTLEGSAIGKLRRKHNYVTRHYPHLQMKPVTPDMKGAIEAFIKQWGQDHKHYFRLTINRDYFLLECLDDLFGVSVWDGDKIVAVDLMCGYLNNTTKCISIMGKHDIKYDNLYDYMMIESIQMAQHYGFQWCNFGSATEPGLIKYKEKFLLQNGYKFPLGIITLFERQLPKKVKK